MSFRKTLVKTILYRILQTITTFAIAYVFTKEVDISSWIAIAEVIIKTIIYYFYERLWIKL